MIYATLGSSGAACAVPPVPEALVVCGGCAFIGIMSSVCRSDDLEIKLKKIMKSIVEKKEREVKVRMLSW